MNNLAAGIEGENMACAYMQNAGMTILMRNYNSRRGEIDVVADDHGVLVFCEVKARANTNMGYALECVTPAKITQIVHAAEDYLRAGHLLETDVRFDVCAVDLLREQVDYVKNAFTAADAGKRNHW